MAGGKDDARLGRVLRGVAVGALTLLVCGWAFFSGTSTLIDSGIEPEGGAEDSYGSGGYAPFGVIGGESTRRQLEPQEMCSWETALEVGAGRGVGRPGAAAVRCMASRAPAAPP